MHHDNQVGGLTLISTTKKSIGATFRPRRGERVKEIYRRISWYAASCSRYDDDDDDLDADDALAALRVSGRGLGRRVLSRCRL
eukprot:6901773-Prymnesium_polylepis.1